MEGDKRMADSQYTTVPCTVCGAPATGVVNRSLAMASGVPSVIEARCDVHNPTITVNREAMAERRLRDAAPLMLEALTLFARARRHSFDDCTCDDDCDAAIELWALVDARAQGAIAAASPPDAQTEGAP
jgi:hypothetical protein